MVKPINSAYDEKGLKILSTPTEPVQMANLDLDAFVKDMIDTASAHRNCIGLSANQIWDNPNKPAPRICLVPGTDGWVICINPMIEKHWKKEIKQDEGCMSLPSANPDKIPGATVNKPRFRHIVVSYYNAALELQPAVHLYDLPARIFQHEIDHLEGKLIDD